ncbi:MAG TPA: hypothetical protein DCP63_00750 [Bacteroidetes bacterium]|nr:hypothetical protein [Bacteroidota bacterium]
MNITSRYSGLTLLVSFLCGCAPSEIKPVDIYPEDVCTHCRMAVSDKSFASEILTADDEALKFDDLGCMETYRNDHPDLKIIAVFVSDYETKTWLRHEKSVIVGTSIATPMGSGRIAVADSARALEIARKFPPDKPKGANAPKGKADCCWKDA